MADKFYKGKYTGEQIDAGIAAANAAAPQETTYTKDEIDETCVKNTDYATTNKAGIVKVNKSYGLFMATGSGINTIAVQTAQPEEVDAEENYFRPLTPFNIKRMMSNYGLTSKALINNILTRLAVLEDGASAQSADVEPEIDKE